MAAICLQLARHRRGARAASARAKAIRARPAGAPRRRSRDSPGPPDYSSYLVEREWREALLAQSRCIVRFAKGELTADEMAAWLRDHLSTRPLVDTELFAALPRAQDLDPEELETLRARLRHEQVPLLQALLGLGVEEQLVAALLEEAEVPPECAAEAESLRQVLAALLDPSGGVP
jgi:hypothetical protein